MARLDRKTLAPHLLDLVGDAFDKAKGTFDAAYTRLSCRDVLMAGLAMFFFKHPSMLAFDRDAHGHEQANEGVVKRVNPPRSSGGGCPPNVVTPHGYACTYLVVLG